MTRTPSSRLRRPRHVSTIAVLRAAASLLVLGVLLVGVPWGLIHLIGNPVPSGWSWDSPATDRAFLGLLAVAVWVIWAQLMICVAVEFAAEARIAAGHTGDWLSRVPGTFGPQQALARTLVQAVVALGVGSTVLTTPLTTGQAHLEALTITPHHTQPLASPHRQGPPSAEPVHSNTDTSASATLVVSRGDSLWSLAQQHLGSGERWREIAAMNENSVMDDGTTFHSDGALRPGWTLRLPTRPDTSHPAAHDLLVEPGDSLWSVADEAYGDGEQWTRVYRANLSQVHDPDLIYPGERLHVPSIRRSAPAHGPTSTGAHRPQHQATAPPESGQPQGVPTPPAQQQRVLDPPGGHGASSTHAPQKSDRAIGDVDVSMLVRTLGGGGVLLAGALSAGLISRRRAQFRNRRPGRTITPTPPELAPVEAVIRRSGSAGAEAAGFLDHALRDLVQRCRRTKTPLPEVAAARLTVDQLELVVPIETSTPPEPWTTNRSGDRWTLRRCDLADHNPSRVSGNMAPYPTLVAVGLDDEQATWLLDLEAAGTVQVTGDVDGCRDLMRFIAAELATNTWSDNVDVLLDALGEELVSLNPARLQTVDVVDLTDLAKTARRVREAEHTCGLDVLAGRVDGDGGDTWLPTVLVQLGETPQNGDTVPGLAELQDELASTTSRSTVAYVVRDGAGLQKRLVLHLDGGGTLTIPWVANLTPNRLTAAEAAALGSLFDASDDEDAETGGVPMPPAAGERPVDAVMDAAGALLTPVQEWQQVKLDEAALSADSKMEVAGGSTGTTDDIASLDPELDADLAEWCSDEVRRPRLRLLGPVELRVAGDAPVDVHRRAAYYTELAAYLALRPRGVTPAQMADALDIQTNTLHTRINTLRKWLGRTEETGQWRLPESTLSPAARTRGVPVYQLDDVLLDADLFRRLRLRAQARGGRALDDYVAALDLVAGRPFEQLRPGGYGWLASDPTDHYLVAAILDLARDMSHQAETAGNYELSARVALLTEAMDPSDDTP